MKRIIIVFLVIAITLSYTIGLAEDYSEYTLEQINTEIAELEARLELLYKLKEEKEPKPASNASAIKTYSGSGDDVVVLDKYEDWFVFEVDGNQAEAYFGVIAYNKSGERLTALVNTSDSYHGIVYDKTQSAATLEVKAKGSWTITVKSLYDMRYSMKGSKIKGSGDEVILFSTDKGKSATATVKGNAGEKYFGIIGYDKYGERISAYVNTSDKYDGKVLLKGDPVIFEIKASGDWEISFE